MLVNQRQKKQLSVSNDDNRPAATRRQSKKPDIPTNSSGKIIKSYLFLIPTRYLLMLELLLSVEKYLKTRDYKVRRSSLSPESNASRNIHYVIVNTNCIYIPAFGF